MKLNIKNMVEEEEYINPEIQYNIQDIVDRVYPHIVNNLGPSNYVNESPQVELWKDIYARASGIEDMEGEESKTSEAEYDKYQNKIFIYYPNMKDEEHIIRSLLHEYTHSLQDPDKREEHRSLGYDDDPDEIEAHQAEESWKDYLRYLPDNLNEQEESKESSTPNGFTPQLITYLKYIFIIYEPTDYHQFKGAFDKELNVYEDNVKILYLTLLYNADVYSINGYNIKNLLNDIPYEKYKISPLYDYYVEFNDAYDSWMEEEECVEDGTGEAQGERSGEECDCGEYEEISVIGPEEEDIEEFIDCTDATEEQLKKAGHDGDCECIEWDMKEVELYQYPITTEYLLSYTLIDDTQQIYDIDELKDVVLGGEDLGFITIQSDTDTAYENSETWNYFQDSEEDAILHLSSETEWEKDEIIDHIREVSNRLTPKPLTEQDEQMNLFPTGEWEFPVGWEEDDDYISDLKHNVPEPVFKKIMTMWDQDGIDFTIFKLLGVRPDTVTNTYVLKRYIQNTTKPIPVSYTFDCNDLKELFDRDNNDYDLSYIPAYLCGDDSFWDSEDWYNYEWDDYMTDAINESNWKTISEIFGGVSQSDAEDILNKSSSSEEVDELIEKYDEEIDEIQNYIVWAYNDENEYAVKNGMAKDIEDKIVDHFNGEGHLHTDNEGSKSWTIEGDLRDYVNDQWDNTDTFEYHPDHTSQPLEDMMLDYTMGNNLHQSIFSALMEEEYIFWDYCEGKQGECLQPETKWFDGYWHPDVDINESLDDRLGELTYDPEEVTQPIHEQDEEGWVTPEDAPKKDAAATGPKLDDTPFTPLDVNILNRLSTMFDRETLKDIWENDESHLATDVERKYYETLKLYGESGSGDSEFGWAKSTRFAKWADDNWDEAERIKEIGLGDDFDPTITYNLDFGLVTQPVKEWPSQYEVEATESYWAKEYRYGSTIIPAYGEKNAEDRANMSWWEWDVDMEYGDQGDTDDHELEIDTVEFHAALRENKSLRSIVESYTNHTLNLYEVITQKYKSHNILSLVELRENVKDYINSNSLNKDMLYIKEVDLIGYLLNRGIIVEDTLEKSLTIEEPEINTGWWKNLPKLDKKYILEHGLMSEDSLSPTYTEDEEQNEIPELIKKFLVIARFDSSGTWGVTPTTFLLYMKPDGKIMYTKKSGSLSTLPSQFSVGNTVTFGDLLSFEKGSRYDLTMRGQIRETYLSIGRKLIERHTIKVTPQKQFYLKSLLREMKTNDIEQLLRIAQDTKVGWQGGAGRLKVFEFLNTLRDSGLVNMFQATDFVWSGSQWLRKYIDLHHPDYLEPIDEYEDNESTIHQKETIQYLLDNADSVRDVIISNVIAKAELKGDNSLEGANRLMRPAAQDMVKLWAGHFVK